MNERNLESMRDKINALPWPDRLRLAADLLEARKPGTVKIAHSIVERVAMEIGAGSALAAMPRKA